MVGSSGEIQTYITPCLDDGAQAVAAGSWNVQ